MWSNAFKLPASIMKQVIAVFDMAARCISTQYSLYVYVFVNLWLVQYLNPCRTLIHASIHQVVFGPTWTQSSSRTLLCAGVIWVKFHGISVFSIRYTHALNLLPSQWICGETQNCMWIAEHAIITKRDCY